MKVVVVVDPQIKENEKNNGPATTTTGEKKNPFSLVSGFFFLFSSFWLHQCLTSYFLSFHFISFSVYLFWSVLFFVFRVYHYKQKIKLHTTNNKQTSKHHEFGNCKNWK